jgi:predicted GIY-YIG superfamily endonuclease
MYYVYLLKSQIDPEKTYVGYTTDLQDRLQRHNSGGSIYTAHSRPWKLVAYVYLDDESKAISFEKYLKSGSGYAFAQKRFW